MVDELTQAIEEWAKLTNQIGEIALQARKLLDQLANALSVKKPGFRPEELTVKVSEGDFAVTLYIQGDGTIEFYSSDNIVTYLEEKLGFKIHEAKFPRYHFRPLATLVFLVDHASQFTGKLKDEISFVEKRKLDLEGLLKQYSDTVKPLLIAQQLQES